MELETAPYQMQVTLWPNTGRIILAQFDANTVVVYQAYAPSIGRFAAEHGHFEGSGFKTSRMTWVKPNFLWMMYRSGWGTKEGQEVVLAIWIKRAAFDAILKIAVHSTFNSEVYSSYEEWKETVAKSNVRLQWDPDHDPMGGNTCRRAIQLGLRGDAIQQFAREWIVGITDISAFVGEQRRFATADRIAELQTPIENVYPISDNSLAKRLGIDDNLKS
jgi:hypothetical protein